MTRPNPRATLARVGIIMYGLEPNYPIHVPMELHPVMSLRSVVSHVKTVEAWCVHQLRQNIYRSGNTHHRHSHPSAMQTASPAAVQ